MRLVLFRFPFLFQFITWLLVVGPVVGQTCIYTDRELLFDTEKEQMHVELSAEGNTHIWRWGTGRVTMDVYDKQLHLVQNQILSRNGGQRLLFASFSQCYYLMLMEPKTTRLLCVQNNTVADKTADFNKIPLEDGPVAQIRKGSNLWFFIQYSPAQDEEHSLMHITAVDSALQYVNSVHLTLRYTTTQLRRLMLQVVGNDLLIMNTSTNDETLKLTVHKLNVITGKVHSNSFLFYDELFIPQEILPFRNGFVLQGNGYKPLLPPRRQSAYTSLLQLDSNLQQTGRYHTGLEDSSLSRNNLHWYLPVSTTVLPSNELLIADYERGMNSKNKAFETRLRFHQIDSGFATVNSTASATKDYSNYPSLVLSRNGQIMIFYVERIKEKLSVVHRYQYGKEAETDRILPLNPKNNYVLGKAIPIGEKAFIMPYIRNYKLGVVKINLQEVE